MESIKNFDELNDFFKAVGKYKSKKMIGGKWVYEYFDKKKEKKKSRYMERPEREVSKKDTKDGKFSKIKEGFKEVVKQVPGNIIMSKIKRGY